MKFHRDQKLRLLTILAAYRDSCRLCVMAIATPLSRIAFTIRSHRASEAVNHADSLLDNRAVYTGIAGCCNRDAMQPAVAEYLQ